MIGGAIAAELSGTAVAWSLVAAVLLILANGFFVAYEFAIIAARQSAFEGPAAEGRRTAKASLAAMKDLSVQLSGAQLGITMASLGLLYVAEPAVAALFERAMGETLSEELTTALAFVIALAISTFLHLVVGEMIPKNIAIAAPEPTMRWLVLPYRVYLTVFRPVVQFLTALANGACRLVGVEPRDELIAAHSAAELASIVAHASESGDIEPDDAELLHGALDFAQRPVGEIARPIDDVATIRLGATAAHAERIVRESGQTRLPIVAPARGEQRIVGYLHAKDLLRIADADRARPLPDDLTRQMAVVRADRSLIDVLRVLRRVRRPFAVVTGAGAGASNAIVSVEEIIRAFVEAGETDPVVPA